VGSVGDSFTGSFFFQIGGASRRLRIYDARKILYVVHPEMESKRVWRFGARITFVR